MHDGLARYVPCDARAIAEAGNLEALQRDLVQKVVCMESSFRGVPDLIEASQHA